MKKRSTRIDDNAELKNTWSYLISSKYLQNLEYSTERKIKERLSWDIYSKVKDFLRVLVVLSAAPNLQSLRWLIKSPILTHEL